MLLIPKLYKAVLMLLYIDNQTYVFMLIILFLVNN